MRPITMMASQFKAATKIGEELRFQNCKGGYYSELEDYGLRVMGKMLQNGVPTPQNSIPIQCVAEGTRIKCCGDNLFGGEAFAKCIETATGVTRNETDKTISLAGNVAPSVEITGIKFKENTQYSMILSGYNTNINAGVSNLRVHYTDGSYQNIAVLGAASKKQIGIFHTAREKTVAKIAGEYISQTATFYYEECGIFEGIISINEFASYKGDEIITPCSLYYEDTWHAGSGKAQKNIITSVISSASLQGNATVLGNTVRCNCAIFSEPVFTETGYSFCSHLKYNVSFVNDEPHFYLYNGGTTGPIFLPITLAGTTKESMGIWLDEQLQNGTPVNFAGKLVTPKTEHFPSKKLSSPKGNVNIFQIPADMSGDLSATVLVSRN